MLMEERDQGEEKEEAVITLERTERMDTEGTPGKKKMPKLD